MLVRNTQSPLTYFLNSLYFRSFRSVLRTFNLKIQAAVFPSYYNRNARRFYDYWLRKVISLFVVLVEIKHNS